MPPRAAALAGHLPSLYREGEVVGGFNQLWGVELDMLDEASFAVQRAHWFDSTPDFDEAAALGALLDIAPEVFHLDINEYRAWVHALTNARLQAGAVTREALRILVDTYTQGFQRAANIDLVPPVASWVDQPDGERAALVENPHRLRFTRLPTQGGWEPLARVNVVNAGIDPAPWSVVITGLAGGPEFAPLIANRTNGRAIVFRGSVGVGSRLTIAPSAADPTVLRAELDGHDVTDRLDSYLGLVPGPTGPGVRSADNPALTLELGDNELWFLPLAHYDTPGLDRFLLALADDALRIGRFDETRYDQSLFALQPEISAWIAWVEHEPASFEVHLPAYALRTPPTGTVAGVAARERLEAGLDTAVDRLAGVGIAADVIMSRHAERQPSNAHLTAIFPRTYRETGPTGADHLADAGAVFDVTDFDDSVLR
ncbi:MAG: hypothetical protein ABWZ42_05105 [Ilumatobacteraceae bacterium]